MREKRSAYAQWYFLCVPLCMFSVYRRVLMMDIRGCGPAGTVQEYGSGLQGQSISNGKECMLKCGESHPLPWPASFTLEDRGLHFQWCSGAAWKDGASWASQVTSRKVAPGALKNSRQGHNMGVHLFARARFSNMWSEHPCVLASVFSLATGNHLGLGKGDCVILSGGWSLPLGT